MLQILNLLKEPPKKIYPIDSPNSRFPIGKKMKNHLQQIQITILPAYIYHHISYIIIHYTRYILHTQWFQHLELVSHDPMTPNGRSGSVRRQDILLMVLMAPGAPRESIETFRDVSSSILNRLTRLKMTLSYSYSIYLYLQISIPFQGKKTDHRPKSVSETIWVDSSKILILRSRKLPNAGLYWLLSMWSKCSEYHWPAVGSIFLKRGSTRIKCLAASPMSTV